MSEVTEAVKDMSLGKAYLTYGILLLFLQYFLEST